jgi:hypothetical protein
MLPAAMMLYDISMRNEPGRSFFRGAATLVYASHFLGYLFLFDGPAATQLCLLAGLVGATLGYQQGQRSLFLAGVLVAVIGAVRNLFMVYAHFNLGGWLTLAILGIGLILLASWIEARGNVVRHYMNSLRSRYADWEF